MSTNNLNINKKKSSELSAKDDSVIIQGVYFESKRDTVEVHNLAPFVLKDYITLEDNNQGIAPHGYTIEVVLQALSECEKKNVYFVFDANAKRDNKVVEIARELKKRDKDIQLFQVLNPTKNLSSNDFVSQAQPFSLERYFTGRQNKSETLNEILNSEEEPIEWYIDNMIPKIGMSVIAAARKTGKSLLLEQFAVAVATGTEFLGVKQEKGKVLYCSLEENKPTFKRRMHKFADNIEGAYSNNNLLVRYRYQVPRLSETGDKQALKHYLEAIMTDTPDINVIILDSYKQIATPKYGNANVEDGQQLQDIYDFAHENNVLLIMSQHLTKGSKEYTDPFDAVEGTNSVTGSMDSTIVLLKERAQTSRITTGYILYTEGREVEEELYYSMERDDNTLLWSLGKNLNEQGQTNQSDTDMLLIRAIRQAVEDSNGHFAGKSADILKYLPEDAGYTAKRITTYLNKHGTEILPIYGFNIDFTTVGKGAYFYINIKD